MVRVQAAHTSFVCFVNFNREFSLGGSYYSDSLRLCCLCRCFLYVAADSFLIDDILVDVVSSLTTFGKFCCGFDLDDRNSRASLKSTNNGGVVVGLCFLVACRLCHRRSDRLSSLSEEPCYLVLFSCLVFPKSFFFRWDEATFKSCDVRFPTRSLDLTEGSDRFLKLSEFVLIAERILS